MTPTPKPKNAQMVSETASARRAVFDIDGGETLVRVERVLAGIGAPADAWTDDAAVNRTIGNYLLSLRADRRRRWRGTIQ